MKKVLVMTNEKVVELRPDELTQIVLTCPKCKAEQILDISSTEQTKVLQIAGRLPITCGICRDVYEPIFIQALQSFLSFHEDISKGRATIRFRICIKEVEDGKDDKP